MEFRKNSPRILYVVIIPWGGNREMHGEAPHGIPEKLPKNRTQWKTPGLRGEVPKGYIAFKVDIKTLRSEFRGSPFLPDIFQETNVINLESFGRLTIAILSTVCGLTMI